MARSPNSKYKEEYCDQIIDFFDREPWEAKTEEGIGKNGNPYKLVVLEPCKLPTFERFAFEIDVHTDTLLEWNKVHSEFSVAYKKAKMLQKDILIQNTLRGLYNVTAAIFTAKNVTDMRDKAEVVNNEGDTIEQWIAKQKAKKAAIKNKKLGKKRKIA